MTRSVIRETRAVIGDIQASGITPLAGIARTTPTGRVG
jgi:hypothetical protein